MRKMWIVEFEFEGSTLYEVHEEESKALNSILRLSIDKDYSKVKLLVVNVVEEKEASVRIDWKEI